MWARRERRSGISGSNDNGMSICVQIVAIDPASASETFPIRFVHVRAQWVGVSIGLDEVSGAHLGLTHILWRGACGERECVAVAC